MHLLCNFVLKLCKSQDNSVLVCEDTAQVNRRALFTLSDQCALYFLIQINKGV